MLATTHIHKSHSLLKEGLVELHRFARIQNPQNRLTLAHPTIKYMHGFIIIFQLMNPTVLTDTLHMQKHEKKYYTESLKFIHNEINENFYFLQKSITEVLRPLLQDEPRP